MVVLQGEGSVQVQLFYLFLLLKLIPSLSTCRFTPFILQITVKTRSVN